MSFCQEGKIIKIRSITHPKNFYFSTPSDSVNIENQFISCFIIILEEKFPFRYKAIRHISIIKAKIRISFLSSYPFLLKKYFSALVMSFYRDAGERDAHCCWGRRAKRYDFDYTQKGGMRWVRGRLFYPYLSIIFNIFSNRLLFVFEHTLTYVTIKKEASIFQLISNWVFPSFINFSAIHRKSRWKFMLYEKVCIWWVCGLRSAWLTFIDIMCTGERVAFFHFHVCPTVHINISSSGGSKWFFVDCVPNRETLRWLINY